MNRPNLYLLRGADIAAQSQTFSHPWSERSEVTGYQMGKATGLRRTGVNLARIAPGKEAFPYHSHWQEEEWIYIVEGGNLRLKDAEVPILREFLLRGGTLTFDDFHGPLEWANVESELRRVFPDRKIIDLPPAHPIFHCFYQFDSFPQTPGLGSFLQGRTYEKGGYVAHLRAIEDDNGRAMVLINWNVDMGDGWEWSNASEYPGYVKYTAQAYRMEINELIYSLTH